MRKTLAGAAFAVVTVASFATTYALLPDATEGRTEHGPLVIRDYRNEASGKTWLITGWAEPEALGIWTDGDKADINLPVRPLTTRASVVFDTAAYIVSAGSKRPLQCPTLHGWAVDRRPPTTAVAIPLQKD